MTVFDWLITNKYVRHEKAGMAAVICLLVGNIVLLIGTHLSGFWPQYFCLALALVIWVVPVSWIAYKMASSENNK